MTAKECLETDESGVYNEVDIIRLMQIFAEIKCKELLKIISKKAEVESVYFPHELGGSYRKIGKIDKNSILNTVDLKEFIK